MTFCKIAHLRLSYKSESINMVQWRISINQNAAPACALCDLYRKGHSLKNAISYTLSRQHLTAGNLAVTISGIKDIKRTMLIVESYV